MSATRKMMLGTNRELDYLIVKENGPTAIGVKPLLGGDRKRGVTFLLRVRAAMLPSAPQSEKIKNHDWTEIFPEIEWGQRNSERASTILVVPTGNQYWEYEALRAKAKFAAEALTTFLNESLHLDYDVEDSQSFLTEAWNGMVDSMEKLLPTTFEETYESPTVLYAHKIYEIASDAEKSPEKLVKLRKPKFEVIQGGKSVIQGGKSNKKPAPQEAESVDEEDDESFEK